ncbi:hypothetical protein BD408DRAFT_62205 [Parasitella parasitica]|nr:hypothetical protein BD408DRAFT_62205 [Parasitella parasitica]
MTERIKSKAILAIFISTTVYVKKKTFLYSTSILLEKLLAHFLVIHYYKSLQNP